MAYTKKQAIDLFNMTAMGLAIQHPNQVITEDDIYTEMLRLGRREAVALTRGWA